MNWAEHILEERYKDMGYDVIRIGIPDLILLKDGKIEFVEVKTNKHKYLSEGQERAIRLLNKHGFKARVETMTIPTIPKKYISLVEQKKIIVQCHHNDLEPCEIYNLIIRSQQHPTLRDFTQVLIAFFNNSHDEEPVIFNFP